jgi:hypothetical protein
MTSADRLAWLELGYGVTVSLDARRLDALDVTGPASIVRHVAPALRAHRAELLAYLRGAGAGAEPVASVATGKDSYPPGGRNAHEHS